MTTKRLPSRGEIFVATVGNLSVAYGVDESAMSQRVYAIAEMIHRHYCLSRGIVNHNEARPDQHVAVSILSALAGTDWWLVRDAERKVIEPEPIEPSEPFVHLGNETVLDAWVDEPK